MNKKDFYTVFCATFDPKMLPYIPHSGRNAIKNARRTKSPVNMPQSGFFDITAQLASNHLIHGVDDRVVRLAQSKTMAKALENHRKPVGYYEFEDENQQLYKQGSRVKMMQKILPFLKQQLQ